MKPDSGSEPCLSDAPSARVMRALREWMADGRLPPGERLPSEQTLAERFHVARTTIRAVLQDLENEGLVELRGRTRIMSHSPRAPESILANVVALLDVPYPAEVTRRVKSVGFDLSIQVGVIEALRSAGLHALCLQPRSLVGAELTRFVSERPRGIVALRQAVETAEGRAILAACQKVGIPIVGYGHAPELAGVDTIGSDHVAGSYALARWLTDRGCRRILRFWEFTTSPRPEWLAQRDQGYEQAVSEKGLDVIPAIELSGVKVAGTLQDRFSLMTRVAIGFLLPHLKSEPRIDAIMAASDGQIPYLAAACRALGAEPNRDVALVGYDNYWAEVPELEWESVPPLATVDKNNPQIGQELVKLMQARIAGELPPEPQHRLVEPRLRVLEPSAAGSTT